MRLIILLLISTVLLYAEDQSYDVNFHIKGKGGGPDVLNITKKTFQDEAIEKHFQFKPAPYKISKEGSVTRLQSTLSSKKHGKVEFQAVIAADGSIAGLRIWSKPGKTPIIHAFTGKKKTK